MIARITYTRRPLWLRLAKPLRILLLRAEIASAEQYLHHCRTGGVFRAAELDKLAANITPLRVALAMWQRA